MNTKIHNSDQQYIVAGFVGLVAIRAIYGPGADLVLAAAAPLLFLRRRPTWNRLSWVMGLFALLAIAHAFLPTPQLPAKLAAPDWASTWLTPAATWSRAPWETVRWVYMFAALTMWSAILQGGRRFRRFSGYCLRLLGLGLAIWLGWHRLGGEVPGAGFNHVGTLLLLTYCEPALRLRGGGLMLWLSVSIIFAGIVATGAWAPIGMAIAVTFWSIAAAKRQKTEWQSKRMWVWAGLLGLAVAAVGQFGSASLGSRLAVWRDVVALAWDAQPWGVGFGSFRWVFPIYADHIPPPALRALHPENSYVWFTIEAGLLGWLILAVLRGAKAHAGKSAQAARIALVCLAVEGLIETPLLWSPILWLLPLWVNLAFYWPTQSTTIEATERESG